MPKPSSFAVAMSDAVAVQSAQENPYDIVLAEARTRLKSAFNPARLENPSEQDLQEAHGIVSKLVSTYQQQALARNLPSFDGESDQVVQMVLDDIFGFGPLAPYMDDPDIEEIICNGPFDIWTIGGNAGKQQVSAQFRRAEDLINFVNRAAAGRGRGIDRRSPTLDVKMRDGSRLHAIMDPLVDNVKIAVTIRRHRLVARTISDLVTLGTVTQPVSEFLIAAVKGRLNTIVTGSTASGKTNFINALCSEIPASERVITVEDTQELQIALRDRINLVTREGAEGANAYTIADLVRQCLRMRPDRVITGEARGPEIVDILAAANTGHDGQMLTVHANSPKDVIQRLETMYLMRGGDVPLIAIRRQIADAFQLIVHLQRVFIAGRPKRFVTAVAEISPSSMMEGDKVLVTNIFEDKGHGLAWTNNYPSAALLKIIQERSGQALDFRRLTQSTTTCYAKGVL